MLLKDIYKKNPVTIKIDNTIEEAVKQLVKNNCKGLFVVDESEKLVGIISLQDIAGATIPVEMQENINLINAMDKENFFEENCQKIKHKKIKNFMRTEFIIASPETNLMEIAADFLKNDLYLVPVIENEKIVGIVTLTEVRKAFASAMKID